MANIVLITQWTGGDVYPFLRIGSRLKKSGHSVTIVTHCIYREKAEQAGLAFEALDSPEEYESINKDLALLADPIGNSEDYVRFHLIYHGKERLLREVEILERVCDKDTIIISRFRSGVSGMLAAEKLHLRYASLILAPNYFSHMELHQQMFGAEFCKEINSARKELGLPDINNWKNWLFSPTYIFCGWPKWFAEPDETWPDSAYPIGFIEETKESPGLFDISNHPGIDELLNHAHRQNAKVAIITGGSSRMVSKSFYSVALEACSLAGMYGLLVTPYEEYVPQTLPDNIFWARNISLRNLMKKADVIVHHGGMGTINEAIDAALPQVLLPHLTDGPDNADRLVNLGIGVKISPKNWKPELIAEEMIRMTGQEQKAICRKYAQMNQISYKEDNWIGILENKLPVYEMGTQIEAKDDIKSLAHEKRQIPKSVLLELARRRQEKKD